MITDRLVDITAQPLLFNLTNFIPSGDLFIKLEGMNIAGSIKLKSAKAMIERAEKEGKIIQGKSTIICSSSGNLALAIAILCRDRGYRAICVSDPNIAPEVKQLIKLYGGQLTVITKKDENGGYLGQRIDYIKQLLVENKNYFWLNQYENEASANAHYEHTAPEILTEIKDVDYLFVGAGTTGTLVGCSRYFKKYSPNTKVIAVDAEGSVTFGNDPKKRKIPGLGTSRVPGISKSAIFDELIYVSEEDTVKYCHESMAKHGLFLGGSSGSVLAAVKKYEKNIQHGEKAVAIAPDFGHKYLGTIYSSQWCENNIRQQEQK